MRYPRVWSTQPRSRAASRANVTEYYGSVPSGRRSTRKRMIPRGAPLGAFGESPMAPRIAPSGAPFPLDSGERKRAKSGESPRPSKATGAGMALAMRFDFPQYARGWIWRRVPIHDRHPEARGAQRRASKGDGPDLAAHRGRSSFEARAQASACHSASKTRVNALKARTSG